MLLRSTSPIRIVLLCLVSSAVAFGLGLAIKAAWHELSLHRARTLLSHPDGTRREAAIQLLHENGVSSTAALIRLLEDSNPEVRLFAVLKLAESRPMPAPVVPAAIELLDSSSLQDYVRWQLYIVLGQSVQFRSGPLSESDRLAIVALEDRLSRKNHPDRYVALEQLSNCVDRVPSVLESIQQYADDPEEWFRLRVAMTLHKHGAYTEEDLIEQLFAALSTPFPVVRSAADNNIRIQDSQRVRDEIGNLAGQYPQYSSEWQRILNLLPNDYE